jgi:hypothetical protein
LKIFAYIIIYYVNEKDDMVATGTYTEIISAYIILIGKPGEKQYLGKLGVDKG